MSPAFWLTVQVGSHRVRIPLPLLLPVAFLLDLLALVVLASLGCLRRRVLFLRLATAFLLSRLALGLILHAGRFRLGVNDGSQRVRLHGGWRY